MTEKTSKVLQIRVIDDIKEIMSQKPPNITTSAWVRRLMYKGFYGNGEVKSAPIEDKNGTLFKKLAEGFYKGFDALFVNTEFPDESKGIMFEELNRHLDMNEVQELKKVLIKRGDINNGRMV